MKIVIDHNAKKSKTDFSWQYGMGNDHAATLLRSDVKEHIKYIHEELGIKYIRFHGIFDDNMLVYTVLGDNKYFSGLPGNQRLGEFNFHEVGIVYDNVLEAGFKPFVELSFMPSRLAKGKKIGFKNARYNNNVCLPKDFSTWERMIQAFVTFLIERYGKDEVESWPFEVWNEPDLGGFFHGNQKDYFQLYRHTVTAIKSINPNIKVGGPSTSACRWVGEFVEFCESNHVPYDFISTHHYPGDGYGNSFRIKDAFKMMSVSMQLSKTPTPLSKVYQTLFFDKEKYKNWARGILHTFDQSVIAKSNGKDIYISEWNSMAVFGAPVHDEKYSAAFIIRSVMDLDNAIKGYMFWCMSDVFEELSRLVDPFQSSYGIISIDGIPKPNFWAFKILSMLYQTRLETPKALEGVEYSVFTNGKAFQVLVYDQSHDYEKSIKTNIDLEIPIVAKKVGIYRIDDEHANPKKYYLDCYRGKKHLTKQEVSDIKEKTKLKKEPTHFEIVNGQTKLQFDISTNDVVMIEIEGE